MFRSNRYLYNIKIIKALAILVLKYPDLRFFQILVAAGIVEYSKTGIIDKFNEESKETFTKVVKRYKSQFQIKLKEKN